MSPVQYLLSAPTASRSRSRSVSRVIAAGALVSVTLTVPATAGADDPVSTRSVTSTGSGVGSTTATGTQVLPAGSARAADTAGAAAPGTTSYAVPAGAVVVSTRGSDAAAGTLAAPVRTLARALVLAPAGGTVVLRAGTYTESVTASKKVTIQSYPREAVWLDGTVAVGGWVKDGTTWRRDGWTKRFDASVGFSKGDVDGTAAGWRWLSPDYPMAAHPDQVWVNGAALRQVSSRAAVTAGRFFLDTATSKLYIGSNPTGVEVRVSSLEKALRVRGESSVVRGIGIRRYAPSIWHIGAVTVEAPKVRFENVTVTDSSTIGLGVVREDAVLSNVSVLRSGLLGVHAATADRIRVVKSRIDGNNTERFNPAPVSGGIKAGRSRGVTVVDSSVSNNLGQGYWSDVSVYDTKILNSNINGNRAAGVFLEISARGTVVNNLIADNGGDGVKINNTSKVVIYNNTVVRNGRPINIVQDPRRPSNTSYGDDTRYLNDPEMTWLIGPVTVRNNVIGLTSTGNCVLCVEDYSHQRTAAQMGVTSNGNVFNRATTSTSKWLTVWSRGTINVNPAVYTTLAQHRSGTGQDGTSLAYDGTVVVTTNGTLSSSVRSRASTAATALPSDVAALAGQPAGVRWFGVFGRTG
ncbi:right-handed parallel beta-helix repeat-containing protein [Oryzobacter terrae]|uniref:right-handed parallel beta-helix repeat-containing protein n=1 Tax=Oryzobacter terrae TaxID=1620385 RepID=UPI00366D4A01